MASKNASLGALDALRSKVKDRTNTVDNKNSKKEEVSKPKVEKETQNRAAELQADKIGMADNADTLSKSDLSAHNNVDKKAPSPVQQTSEISTQMVDQGKSFSDSANNDVAESDKITTTAASSKTKKRPGRKKVDANKRRVQLTLTISHDVNDKLAEWSKDMPKSGSRLLSDYIDYHLDDIIEYYNKLL